MSTVDFGYYGQMAARHMATWRPAQYASILEAERESYFRQLDETVTQAIRDREHSSMPPSVLASQDHREYAAQMNMSHLMAEAAVLADLVLLTPEPGLSIELGEPETDPAGAYLDRGWRSPRVELSVEEWDAQQEGII